MSFWTLITGTTSRNLIQVPPIQSIVGTRISASTQVRNLAVILDSELTLCPQINIVVGTCFYALKQLRAITKLCTWGQEALLTGADVNSRLDYCNALYGNLPKGLVNRLQTAPNVAARFILNISKRNSVRAFLRELHCLWLQRESGSR